LRMGVAQHKPFGQYWGIQAMGRILAEMRPTDVPRPVHDAIEAFAERFQRSEPGTDRAYELGRILKQLRSEQI